MEDLYSLDHLLTEYHHGPLVDTQVTQAVGTGEREAAIAIAVALRKCHVTLGAETNCHTEHRAAL